MTDLLDRLSRRGRVTMTLQDGTIDLHFKAPGPYRGRAWCTADEGDLYEWCRLGAKDWHGEGSDLAALLADCDGATRPQHRTVDELVWAIEHRRDTRTYGPPLPTYRRWHGWSPGEGRWLRTSSHKNEYLAGYLHYGIKAAQEFETEALARAARRAAG